MKWDKLKAHPTNLLFLITLTAVSIGVAATGYFYRGATSHLDKLTGLKLGANVCASRVAQSYFSFNNGNLLSAKLEDRFLSNSDNCFLKLDENTKGIGESVLVSLSTDFYDQFIRFKNLVRNADSKQYKVSKSYNDLDKVKYSFSVKASKLINEQTKVKSRLKYAFMLLSIAMFLLCAWFVIAWRKFNSALNLLENEAMSLMNDYHGNEVKIERLVERTFEFINIPMMKNLFVDYHHHVLTQGKAVSQLKGIEHNSEDVEIDESYILKVFNDADDNQKLELSTQEESLLDEMVSPILGENTEPNIEFNMTDITSQEIEDEPEALVEAQEQRSEEDAAILKEIVETATKINSSEVVASQEITGEEQTDNTQEALLAVEGKSFKGIIAKVSRAFLRNTSDSGLSWEFASNYKDFKLQDNFEEFDHIIHALLTRFHKGFDEAGVELSQRCVEINTQHLHKDIQACFVAKKVLFNTAELEYLNTMDPSLKKMVDISFVMLQKLVLDMNAEIEAQNVFNLEGTQEAVVRIFIPLVLTDSEITTDEQKKESGLRRLLRGSKKQILKTLNKENIV